MLRRLSSFAARRRTTVTALWCGVITLAVLSAPMLFGGLSSDVGDLDNTESARAADALWRAAPSGESIYAVADGREAADRGLRRSVNEVAHEVAAIPGVAQIRTPWTTTGDRGQAEAASVSSDGRAIAIEVDFAPTDAGEAAVDPAAAALHRIDAPQVLVGGGPLLDAEKEQQAAHDLAKAELIALPVMLVLLIVIFGGLIAAGIPIVIAIVATAATLLALACFSLVVDVSVYALNIVTMLGLGLAVDYALLIVTRFREERRRYGDVDLALTATMATAGRTVIFSGLTVAASLAGLLVFPDDFLRSMGFAGLAVVLLDMLAAVTLVPALLSKFGHRITPSRLRADERGGFASTARWAGRHPAVVIVGVVGVLGLAALPFASARFSDPDERSLPESSPTRQLAEIAQTRFTQISVADPVTVVMAAGIPGPKLDSYVSELRDLDGARSVDVRTDVPGLTVVDVFPEGDTQGTQAIALVHEMRALDTPAAAEVGGDAAELIDYEQALMSRFPLAVGLVVLSTFVLLFLFTGSVVIPVKALVMNTLSLGASFGALVWVFQEGHLGGLVGTEALGSLSITTPTLVFALAFGLSMDYEVFLLGRITEVYRRTGDTNRAVEVGLQRTGRVVTAAALLMVVVYAAFVSGGFSPVKQLGLGMVIAVAVDALLIRLLLLPAVMAVMGQANWWAPSWMRRLHRRIGIADEPSQLDPTPFGGASPAGGVLVDAVTR